MKYILREFDLNSGKSEVLFESGFTHSTTIPRVSERYVWKGSYYRVADVLWNTDKELVIITIEIGNKNVYDF